MEPGWSRGYPRYPEITLRCVCAPLSGRTYASNHHFDFMAKVLVTRALPAEGLEQLYAAHEVRIEDPGPEVRMDEDRLISLARDAEAIISVLSDPVTARVIDACPKLRAIAQFAVGYDNIDLNAAQARGIVVTNTPGVLTDATADFAFALLLGVSRRLCEADRFVREGRFVRWETMLLLGTDLRGKTLGIVGMGRIGAAMARRALGFGMRILYYNRSRANLTLERLASAHLVSFEKLLEESDVVSIHCPLNAASRGLFDLDAFRKMKPTSILINTARGPVVDEEALVQALDERLIAGSGLDVFEREPEVHSGLLKHDRVVLAPHLGSATIETRTEMAKMCAEAVMAVFGGLDPIPYRLV